MKKLLFILIAVAAGALIVANTVALGATTKRVAIVHVQKGCHVWSVGALKTPNLRLSLHRGDTLAVVNQDLDMHNLVEVSGPPTNTGGFMMMNQRVALRFTKAGLYRFHTRVADMRGMPEAKTIGPDNKLVLTVRVS
jgi:plastocyanin